MERPAKWAVLYVLAVVLAFLWYQVSAAWPLSGTIDRMTTANRIDSNSDAGSTHARMTRNINRCSFHVYLELFHSFAKKFWQHISTKGRHASLQQRAAIERQRAGKGGSHKRQLGLIDRTGRNHASPLGCRCGGPCHPSGLAISAVSTRCDRAR